MHETRAMCFFYDAKYDLNRLFNVKYVVIVFLNNRVASQVELRQARVCCSTGYKECWSESKSECHKPLAPLIILS